MLSPDAVVKVWFSCSFSLFEVTVLIKTIHIQVDVPGIGPDDMVKVLDDIEKVMTLQRSMGIEWEEDICDVSKLIFVSLTLCGMSFIHLLTSSVWVKLED